MRHHGLGLILSAFMMLAAGCDGTPTIKHVLANGPGPVDADAPDEFSTTDTGLKYRMLRKGEGPLPTTRDEVVVMYAGWLDNGRQFDSTYNGGQPFKTSLNHVIRGWTEGLQLMAEGGMVELEIPGDLGYGARGYSPSIPPNATLHFLIELKKVLPGPEPLEPGSADPDAPEEFTTTETGLQFRILRPGNDRKPKSSDTVVLHYRGSLDDGTVFDSSYDTGVAATLGMIRTIPGWKEGMKLIGEGGMIELIIPSDLAYGAEGRPPRIPPNSTIHFLVELVEILPP